jgi:hypothetical protein
MRPFTLLILLALIVLCIVVCDTVVVQEQNSVQYTDKDQLGSISHTQDREVHPGLHKAWDRLYSELKHMLIAPFMAEPVFDVFLWRDRFTQIYTRVWRSRHISESDGSILDTETVLQHDYPIVPDLSDMSVCDRGDPLKKYTYTMGMGLLGKMVIRVEHSNTIAFRVQHKPLLLSVSQNETGEIRSISDIKWAQPISISCSGLQSDSIVLFSIETPLSKTLAYMNTTLHNMTMSCELELSKFAPSALLSNFSVSLGPMEYVLCGKNTVEEHMIKTLAWFQDGTLKHAIESYIRSQIEHSWIKFVSDSIERFKDILPPWTRILLRS